MPKKKCYVNGENYSLTITKHIAVPSSKLEFPFLNIKFLAQKIPFLRTFSLTSRNSCFASEIWKSDKNHSKCAKTVDHH